MHFHIHHHPLYKRYTQYSEHFREQKLWKRSIHCQHILIPIKYKGDKKMAYCIVRRVHSCHIVPSATQSNVQFRLPVYSRVEFDSRAISNSKVTPVLHLKLWLLQNFTPEVSLNRALLQSYIWQRCYTGVSFYLSLSSKWQSTPESPIWL